MKRRLTKKALHELEILLADSLRLYFTTPKDRDEEKNEKLGRDIVALSLSMLMSLHLQLRSCQRITKRWISVLTLADVALDESATITGHGELQWSESGIKPGAADDF